MADFKPSEYMERVKDPENYESENYESLKKLRRRDLMALCKYYGWEAKSTLRKPEVFKIVLYNFVDAGYIPESVLDEEVDSLEGTDSAQLIEAKAKAQAEVMRAQAELVKAQAEAKAKEAEAKVKEYEAQADAKVKEYEAQADARMKEAKAIELEAKARSIAEGHPVHSNSEPVFDPTKHVRLVPPFYEKDLDSFFQTFEHNAQTLSWPRDK